MAGRSNGLGPVLSGNTSFPVINCPPVKPENVQQDIWSSLNVPSGESKPGIFFSPLKPLYEKNFFLNINCYVTLVVSGY